MDEFIINTVAIVGGLAWVVVCNFCPPINPGPILIVIGALMISCAIQLIGFVVLWFLKFFTIQFRRII